MEFDFVDEGGEAGDAAGAFLAKGELIGEPETVEAAGIHELEGLDEAGEHGVADDMDDGLALAIGLVVGLATQHEIAAIVEANALGILGFGTLARTNHLVVESFGMTLRIGVGGFEVGEEFLLLTVDLGALVAGDTHGIGALEEGEEFEGIAGFLLGDGLRLAVEGVADSLQNELGIEGVEDIAGKHVGEVLSIGPREGVYLGGEFGGRGFVALAVATN